MEKSVIREHRETDSELRVILSSCLLLQYKSVWMLLADIRRLLF